MADVATTLIEQCPACGGTGCGIGRDACDDCDGAGELAPTCDAAPWIVTTTTDDAGARCYEPAVGRCGPCGEPLCTRHLAWHRAECGEEPTP